MAPARTALDRETRRTGDPDVRVESAFALEMQHSAPSSSSA
jgi:hypothetical protein